MLCPGCQYDLSGSPDGLCPECGRAFTHAELRLGVAEREENPNTLRFYFATLAGLATILPFVAAPWVVRGGMPLPRECAWVAAGCFGLALYSALYCRPFRVAPRCCFLALLVLIIAAVVSSVCPPVLVWTVCGLFIAFMLIQARRYGALQVAPLTGGAIAALAAGCCSLLFLVWGAQLFSEGLHQYHAWGDWRGWTESDMPRWTTWRPARVGEAITLGSALIFAPLLIALPLFRVLRAHHAALRELISNTR